MKRFLLVLYVLILCVLSLNWNCAVAEERRDEAHRYDEVGPVSEGFTWATTWDGEEDKDIFDEGMAYIIDVYGNRLTDETYTVYNRYFSNGLVTVYKDDKAGCIDTEGNVVIPFEFYEIKAFNSAGYAMAALGETWDTALWGIIDRQGQWVIPCEWDSVSIRIPSEGSDRLVLVWKDGKAGILNMAGETVLPCEYSMMQGDHFYEGRLHIKREGEGYGYVNELGKLVIPCQWTYASDFSEGLARVLDGEKSGYIDRDGNLVIGLPADWHARDDFHDDLALVQNEQGLYGYIDQTGALAIPFQWEKAAAFSEGVAQVWLDGKCGFIDRTGAYISPCQWVNAEKFLGGHAIVQDENSLMGIIDREGRLTVPCVYASLQYLNCHDDSQNPTYEMKDRIQGVNLYGLIRADGAIVSPCQWSLISGVVKDGIVQVYLGYVSASTYDEWDGQEPTCGFMDLNGNLVVPCEYYHGYYNDGYFTLIKDGYLTILDRDTNPVF